MTQAWNLSQLANKVNTSGQLDVSTGASGTLPIANGGTNSTATPTAGGVIYGTGTAMATTAAGTAGTFLQSNGASAPSWATLSAAGALNNVQYFTASGTYTATSGTSFVIVEVIGGGGGATAASSGGTSSFGAFCSATGGGPASGTGAWVGGAGSGGDLNVTGTYGSQVAAYTGAKTNYVINAIGGIAATGQAGRGASQSGSLSNGFIGAAGGGGYARKKILSGFSGTSVTVGAAGTGAGNLGSNSAGIVIVYEYK